MNENRRYSILFHLLVRYDGLPAWDQAWHLPSLASNDPLMPGLYRRRISDGEVGRMPVTLDRQKIAAVRDLRDAVR
jgi:hypothetical protein